MSTAIEHAVILGRFGHGQVRAALQGQAELSRTAAVRVHENWRTLLDARPQLFDGPMCSVVDVKRDEQGLNLKMVRSSYSHYVATRQVDLPDGLLETERCNPLGLTALVVTADDFVVASLRSEQVDQNPGAVYFAGGYATPGEDDGLVDLFAEVSREIFEELGFSTDVSRICLMGVEYDPEWIHPEAFFLVKTDLTFAEIEQSAENASDQNEFTYLIAVPRSADSKEVAQHLSKPLTWSFKKGWAFLDAYYA